MTIEIIICILSVIMIFAIYLCFIRNTAVYDFRGKIIEEVFNKTIPNEEFEKRYKEFNSVSYNKMVFKFWKPLRSFYKTLGK